MNFKFYADRAKYCLKDSRCPPLAVYQADSDPRQESQEISSEEKEEARDPSPAVAGRCDFWTIMGDYIYRNHVVPRTKLDVLEDDFPIP